MKALVYERAHNLEDFAIKLAEISERTLRELDVLVGVYAVGINPDETFIQAEMHRRGLPARPELTLRLRCPEEHARRGSLRGLAQFRIETM